MKNIHILTTLNPSRVLRGFDGIRLFKNEVSPDNQWCVNVNIHITNDEEIKDGDKRINNYQMKPKGEEIPSKKIILTTDQDLIKDGVQAIPDEFLEWFVKNPSCEEVKVDIDYSKSVANYSYKIIIPKEEPKQELLEEAAERLYPTTIDRFTDTGIDMSEKDRLIFIAGANYMAERMYSEEEVLGILVKAMKDVKVKQLTFFDGGSEYPIYSNLSKWFEQFKKK
jgi:hypothetical protein